MNIIDEWRQMFSDGVYDIIIRRGEMEYDFRKITTHPLYVKPYDPYATGNYIYAWDIDMECVMDINIWNIVRYEKDMNYKFEKEAKRKLCTCQTDPEITCIVHPKAVKIPSTSLDAMIDELALLSEAWYKSRKNNMSPKYVRKSIIGLCNDISQKTIKES